MVGSRLTVTEQCVNLIMDEASNKCARQVEECMTRELRERQRLHFPRRKVELIDAMGLISIQLDGRDVMELVVVLGERAPDWLVALDSLASWYCRVADTAKVNIELTLEPIR